LRSAAAVAPGARLDIEFGDGRVGALAEGEAWMRPVPAPRARRRRGGPASEDQGNLFGA
jgi:exodeoxyribonuclease VII large subunit